MTAQRIAVDYNPLARIRRPRVQSPKHLAFIRQLPCIITWNHHGVEAAHIRYADLPLGKLPTGMGEKPSDCWTIPLHATVHRTDKNAQHNMNERSFWSGHNINPCVVALALWRCSGDIELGEMIIREARSWRPYVQVN